MPNEGIHGLLIMPEPLFAQPSDSRPLAVELKFSGFLDADHVSTHRVMEAVADCFKVEARSIYLNNEDLYCTEAGASFLRRTSDLLRDTGLGGSLRAPIVVHALSEDAATPPRQPSPKTSHSTWRKDFWGNLKKLVINMAVAVGLIRFAVGYALPDWMVVKAGAKAITPQEQMSLKAKLAEIPGVQQVRGPLSSQNSEGVYIFLELQLAPGVPVQARASIRETAKKYVREEQPNARDVEVLLSDAGDSTHD